MDGELLCEIIKRIKGVAGIKTFLVFTVAALDLTVVTRGIWANQLMPDAKFGSSPFKQRRQIALAVGKTVGKFKAVVRLDTFHLYASAGVPRPQLPQKVSRGIGGLLRIGGEEAQARELVDGGVLEQAKLRVCNTFTGYDLHIHLNAFSGMGHLLVRLGFVRLFRLFGRKHPLYESRGTDSPGSGYSRAAADGAKARSYQASDFGGACHR